MKHTIIIRPLPPKAGGRFNADRIKYKDDIEYACLRSLKAVRRDQLKPSDEPISQYITKTSTTFSFNFEDSDSDTSTLNKERKFFADVLKYHPMMHTEGFKNPRMGSVVLFEYEDLAMNDVRNYNTELLLLTAKNKAHQMSYPEKLDAFYFYGENPMVAVEVIAPDGQAYTTIAAMDHRQLWLRMIADHIGLVLRRTPFGNTGMTYVEHFVKEYKKNDEIYGLKTAILKALILKDGDKTIIKKNDNAFILGDDIIGSNIEECVAWLNNNPKRKKYLMDTVKQSDTVGVDNLDEAMENPDSKNVEEDLTPKTNIDDLIKEAQDLKVRLWHQLRNQPERLLKEVEAARAIWREVKQLGLQSEVDHMQKPTLENIGKLVEKRKEKLLQTV